VSRRDRLRNPAPWLSDGSTSGYAFKNRRSKAPSGGRRFGLLDAVVVAVVLLAVWSRTPVGAVVELGVSSLIGADTEGLRPLTAYFDTGRGEAEAVTDLLAELDPASAAPEDGLPEPWRTAAQVVLTRHAPAQARQALREAMAQDPEATWLTLLDARYDGDPAGTLERLVIDEDQRQRAIARALAAGSAHPERWEAHRAYLPLRDRQRGDRVVGRILALGTALDLTWPVASPHRVTSPWGVRHHPVLKTRKFHNGVDLGVPIGTPILAAQGGVVRTGEDGVSGRYVVIDHGHGVRTSYCHLDAVHVSRGQRVEPGERIGLSGNTGRSTGPHLHFVVRIGRKTVDPERLRRAKDGKPEPAG